MKRFITGLVILTLILTACGNGGDNGTDNNNNSKTTLTITNLNFPGYIEAAYGPVNFGLIGNLGSGSVTKSITAGTHYVYLTDHVFSSTEHREGLNLNNHNPCNCPVLRTNSVTCEEGKSNQYNITKNTVVTFINGYGYNSSDEITGTLQDVSDNVTNKYYEYLNGLGLLD